MKLTKKKTLTSAAVFLTSAKSPSIIASRSKGKGSKLTRRFGRFAMLLLNFYYLNLLTNTNDLNDYNYTKFYKLNEMLNRHSKICQTTLYTICYSKHLQLLEKFDSNRLSAKSHQ